jgi:hypothetical protein
VAKFQKAVTQKVFEVRSPYRKPVISYSTPGFYRAVLTFLKIRPVEKAEFLINPPYSIVPFVKANGFILVSGSLP